MNKHKKGFMSYIIVLLIAIMLAGAIVFNLYMNSLKPIKNLRNYTPNHVTQIISADDVVIKTFGVYKTAQIDETEIPDVLKEAIISIEDKNFYKHEGYDLIALVRSTVVNLKARSNKQGASTITQQLSRILFLSSEKTYTRKIKELIIARRIEKSLTKDEILTMYLNNVYLGEGAYGVAAAADVYFGKNIKNLTVPEAALIAGLPQAPSIYSPYQNMDLAVTRRNQVITRMEKLKFITHDEAEQAKNSPIKLRRDYISYSQNKAPYFSDYVMRELNELGFTENEISQGGYKIYTTLNYQLQQEAQDAVWNGLRSWGLTGDSQQAALFSYETTTGKILAYVGGKDYSKSQFDRVTQAVRPPGSAFKVFVYTSALEQGMEPNMLYEDTPYTIAEWSPRNYGKKYRGKIPAYLALAYSSNVIAARMIMDAGIGEVIGLARRLGITTPLENDPTIALGSNSVKLFEMTKAYGALADGGILVKPYAVERIETAGGKEVYKASPSFKRVLSLDTAAKIVAMMKLVITQGTGRAANIGVPAAGKTGTTDDYRDAWFVGFTPDIVTGVWVGNDDNTTIKNLTGGTVPAVIWRGYMRKAMANMPKNDFPFPQVELKIPEAVKEENPTEGEEIQPTTEETTTDEQSLTEEGSADNAEDVLQQAVTQGTQQQPSAAQDVPPPPRVLDVKPEENKPNFKTKVPENVQ